MKGADDAEIGQLNVIHTFPLFMRELQLLRISIGEQFSVPLSIQPPPLCPLNHCTGLRPGRAASPLHLHPSASLRDQPGAAGCRRLSRPCAMRASQSSSTRSPARPPDRLGARMLRGSGFASGTPRQWLLRQLMPVVAEGLATIAKERPADPVSDFRGAARDSEWRG